MRSAVRNTLPTLYALRIFSNTTMIGILSDCLNSATVFRFNSSMLSFRMIKDTRTGTEEPRTKMP
jgi:hypothetical protein